MKRLLSIFAAVAIAGIAAPVSAASEPPDGHPFIHDVPSGWLPVTPDQYHYSRSWGGWVDDRCGTQQEGFRLIIFEHVDYGGAKTRVCHSATNRTGVPTKDSWCELPLGFAASWQAVDVCNKGGGLLKTGGVANDRVSSFKIYGQQANECLRFFSDANHGYRWLTRKWNTPDLHSWAFHYPDSAYKYGDRISSTMKKAGPPCDKTYGQN